MRLTIVKMGKLTWRALAVQSLLTGVAMVILLVLSQGALRPVFGGQIVDKPLWFGLCGLLASVIAQVLIRVRIVRQGGPP